MLYAYASTLLGAKGQTMFIGIGLPYLRQPGILRQNSVDDVIQDKAISRNGIMLKLFDWQK